MTEQVKCPFNEPIPPGRKTMDVPVELRQGLADLERQRADLNGKMIPLDPSRRDPEDTFGTHVTSSFRYEDRVNEIERIFLGRPDKARIAYHPGWRYSIETAEVLAQERQPKTDGMREWSILEQLVDAFRNADAFGCPYDEEPPKGEETFIIPHDIHGVTCFARVRHEIADEIGQDPCNGGGGWARAEHIACALDALIDDYLRKVYGKSGNHQVSCWKGFVCTFTLV
ncbi:MAG TPA: hypothetical protein VG102_03585 [Candidatus Paceibacterota bacterium]|jgi:hypothetical protein|nr:hypothetical protein [Candidatus Paceibacterota bacterium]